MDTPHRGSSCGVELTDDVIERLADEAVRGYDVDRLRPVPHDDEPAPAAGPRVAA